MRKKFFILLTLIIATVMSVFVSASDYVYGEWYYDMDSNDNITIVEYDNPDAEVVVIPSDFYGSPVTGIGRNAFEDCSMTEIIIPDTVTEIGDFAFKNCKNLEQIIIPESVTTIRVSAFYGCSALETISLPDGIETLSIGLFYFCKNLEEVNIPDSVTYIDSEVFYGCENLKEIELPEKVVIDREAFNSSGIYNDESNWEKGRLFVDGHYVCLRGTYKVTIIFLSLFGLLFSLIGIVGSDKK